MKSLKKIKKYLALVILMGCFLLTSSASAFSFKDSFKTNDSSLATFAQKSSFDKNPATIESYIGLIITAFFSILGIISITLIIYSGFTWMTARGNEAQVTKAKENFFNVTIGLIFIIGAYALTTFLLKIFN